jgi:hypothetical protein
MNSYDRIYNLLCEQVRGGSRKVSHEGLGEIPKKKARRVQPQTQDTGGSELEKAQDARIGASEKTTKDVMMGDKILAALNKPGVPPLILARIRALALKRGMEVPKEKGSANEAQDRYWPGWSGARKTKPLTPQERRELLKQLRKRQKGGGITGVTPKRKQGTFKF